MLFTDITSRKNEIQNDPCKKPIWISSTNQLTKSKQNFFCEVANMTPRLSVLLSGITELSALFILSEIGADMSVFESDRHLCSWAGLTPANNESASKKSPDVPKRDNI